MGAAVGDIDSDGDLDLYVSGFGANTLLRNNGDGTFRDVTRDAGLVDARWSTSAAFVDYDRDGDLDLYVGHYVAFTMAGNKTCTDPVGVRDYCAPAAWPAVPDRLLRNDGDGRFTDVSEPAGITRAYGPALGVAVGDLDADGWPDIYVANDAQPNQLWRNRRDGTFEDIGLLSGTRRERGRAAGRQHGHRARRSRERRRRGHLRQQPRGRVARPVRQRRRRQLRRCAHAGRARASDGAR